MSEPDIDAVPRRVPLTKPVLLTLGALAALGPLAIDLYLSAFPAMAAELQSDPTGIQLSLTGYLLGVAAGQLTFGALSDRFGRRTPLLVGLCGCVIASIAAALAPSLAFLIAARIIQGFSIASAAVIGRAIISDVASGDAAARAISVMMIVGGVAPIIAPTLGSIIGSVFGWRGILAVVGITATALIVAVLLVIKESHGRARRANIRSEQDDRRQRLAALGSRRFLGNAIAMAFSTGVMMTYIAASPFVYQEMMGFSPVGFGLMFGANATAMLLVNWWSTRLIGRFRVRSILGGGILAICVSCALTTLLVIFHAPAIWLVAPLFISVAAVGAVAPKATAEAIAQVPRVAGTGSAIVGTLQFTVGAAVTPLASIGGTNSAQSMAFVMTVCAAVMAAGFLAAHTHSATSTGRRRGERRSA